MGEARVTCLNPAIDISLVFKWRSVEVQAYYPPNFEMCTFYLGDFVVLKRSYDVLCVFGINILAIASFLLN